MLLQIHSFKHSLNQNKGINLGIKKSTKSSWLQNSIYTQQNKWYQEQRNQVLQLPEGNQKMGFLIAQQGKTKKHNNKTLSTKITESLQTCLRKPFPTPLALGLTLPIVQGYFVIVTSKEQVETIKIIQQQKSHFVWTGARWPDSFFLLYLHIIWKKLCGCTDRRKPSTADMHLHNEGLTIQINQPTPFRNAF